jgi:hypothetical protein
VNYVVVAVTTLLMLSYFYFQGVAISRLSQAK